MKKSYFGRGLCYNLGLFLAHSERNFFVSNPEIQKIIPEMFFYTASDHLYDLEIPDTLPISLQRRIKKFRDFVFSKRLNNPSEDDMKWATREAKTLLRLIDKSYGIKTKKGDYE